MAVRTSAETLSCLFKLFVFYAARIISFFIFCISCSCHSNIHTYKFHSKLK